jgi:protein SCO1/2
MTVQRGHAIRAAALVLLALIAAAGVVQYSTRRGLAPDFTLTDQDGQPFTLSAQRGKAVVLFFGYTHCGDVCPTTLAHIAVAIRSLGPGAAAVEPVIVTVDPARDSSAVLKTYVAHFGTGVVGLTGSSAALDRVYGEYHVFHQQLPRKEGQSGYEMAHTSLIYYIDGSGRLHGFGDWTDGAGDIAQRLKEMNG